MKGRFCAVIFFAIIGLLFANVPGHSKSTVSKQTKPASAHTSRLNSELSYSVQSGDTLYQIARDFGTTPGALKSANGLRSSRIKPGQILAIPATKSAALKTEPRPHAETTVNPSEIHRPAAAAGDAGGGQPADSQALSARLRLVQAGFQMIGVRYRFGGSGLSGIDCSGLVKNLFSKFNIDLPRSSREQFKQGQKIDRDQLEIGDLVFFSSGGTQPTHVGIYVGNNQFLHAARKAKQVIVSDLSKLWYTMRYLGARRVTDLWADEPVAE
jgi:cell wall-associated NlpC family hydrolase